MNYESFRTAWNEALEAAGLMPYSLWPEETVELKTMDRGYQVAIPYRIDQFDPFTVSARLRWKWPALLSARFDTSEEDLLREIFSDFGGPVATEQPLLRVDLTLNAALPEYLLMPFPSEKAWRRWTAEVLAKLVPLFPSGRLLDAQGREDLSWRGEPAAEARCSPSGQLYLERITLAAWQGIYLPRQWDDPGKERDETPDRQLNDFARRVRQGMQAWAESLKCLLEARANL